MVLYLAVYNSTVHYGDYHLKLDHHAVHDSPGPDGVDCNGEDEFNSAGTTLRQLRHTGILDSAMQVRTPDVAVVPTEISS